MLHIGEQRSILYEGIYLHDVFRAIATAEDIEVICTVALRDQHTFRKHITKTETCCENRKQPNTQCLHKDDGAILEQKYWPSIGMIIR